MQGLDHYRSEFEGEFNGNPIKGVTVLNGDKGWRKFGENAMEMDEDAVANEKRIDLSRRHPIHPGSTQGKGLQGRDRAATKRLATSPRSGSR